jgi:hypothetical protein
MTAYTEENFNKLLDAFNEMKMQRDAYMVSSSRLCEELVKEHHYNNKGLAYVIGGWKDDDILD